MRVQGPSGISVRRVDRATADVLTGAAVAIFTIGTGRVWLFGIVGEVTTVLGAGANSGKFQSNPTTGTTTDLCANGTITTNEAGTLYSLATSPATALVISSSGGPRADLMGNPIVIPIGDIEFITTANVTGSIKFSAWWAPFDDSATLVAA